jgi:uncharacterized repeat protein (TIGR01451 family)
VNCDAAKDPGNTGTASAADNCTDVVTNISFADTRTNGSCNDNYTITRVWTAVDSCGNSNNCQQIITVQDTTRPAITCPSNVTIDCDAVQDPGNTGTASATDNCTDVVTNISYKETKTGGNGSYVITRVWTAVDSCGNSNNCTQVITVQDTTPPMITCPVDVTINCEVNTDPVNTGTASASDKCTDAVTNISYVDSRTNGSCNDNYTITRTWTVVDSSGNSSTCIQTLTIQDTTKPLITCPADVTINCDSNTDPSQTGTASATDNCTNVITNIGYTDVKTEGSCYTIIRTWTVQDSCGNINSCEQKITVQDTVKPNIKCPADAIIDCNANNAPVTTGMATATDNCTAVVRNISYDDVKMNGTGNSIYSVERTWTAIDSCGNPNSCKQLITVKDTTPPGISCPADLTISCEASTDPTNTGGVFVTDNCTDMVTNIGFVDVVTKGICNSEYKITRTWTAKDSSGNASNCIQTISVQDTTKPIIICPVNLTINCDSNTDPSNTGIATATDNCTEVVTDISYSDSKTIGSCYTINRTWTAVDSCGNSISCVQIITVQDTTRPVINCPINKTINCDDSKDPFNTGFATATDNCTDILTNMTYADRKINGNCNDNYILERVWTVVDSCGNANTCKQNITVQDTTPPVIICPVSLTINCDAGNDPASTGKATASDNCTDVVTNISYTDSKTNGSNGESYVINRTWIAVDSCGNSSRCVQIIAMKDTTPPVINCPLDLTINCDISTDTSGTGVAVATDYCTDVVTNITYVDIRVNGYCNNAYSITRTWTAIDSSGNVKTCIQKITVQDTTRPLISCPPNLTINCNMNTDPAQTGTATASDNCSDLVTNIKYNDSRTNGSCADNYLITRVWTAIDSCGNSGICKQLITVQDTTKPTITCPADITLNCEDGVNPSKSGSATATDNCTDVITNISYSDSKTIGNCISNYSLSRTWMATDSCGNSKTCVQKIQVQDTTKPIIICPASIFIDCISKNDTSNTGSATATDNCLGLMSNLSFSDILVRGKCAGDFKLTRTWMATDSCGNSSSCVQIISVENISTPEITCPADITVNCDDAASPLTTGKATATAKCSGVINTIDYIDERNGTGCSTGLIINRTWSAVDSCGNIATCVQHIYLIDTVKPVITCPKNVTVNCQIQITPANTGTATAIDNCSGVVTNIKFTDDRTNGSCVDNYSITRTWEAYDSCGNMQTCIQKIAIQDTTRPKVFCPEDLTLNCDVSLDPERTGKASAKDNCTNLVTEFTYTDVRKNGSCSDNFSLVRTWVGYDSCGNKNSCTQLIKVQDTSKPEILCPPDISISCELSKDTSVTGAATASDKCTEVIKNITYIDLRTNGSCSNSYLITRTWRASDSCGNVSTCQQSISIEDTTKPVVLCPVNKTINCDVAADTAITGVATATDNCSGMINDITYVDNKTRGSCNDNYFIVRTWTAVDSCGNASTCLQNITVQDTTKPIVYCPSNITINCDASADTSITGVATGIDNCTDIVFNIAYTNAKINGSCRNNYIISRTWTAEDSCGNIGSCIQLISVQDTTPPVITCPVDLTINCDVSTDPSSTGKAKASDNCSGKVSNIIYSDVKTIGGCNDNYTISRTWTAKDSCGNSGSCLQTISIQNNIKPTMNCPPDVTISCHGNTDPASTGTASAVGGCKNVPLKVKFTDVSTNGSCGRNYTITRTWIAIDSCGNVNSCIQTISIKDTIKPSITCPPNTTINCQQNASPSFLGIATASDDCTNQVTDITYADTRINGSCPDNYAITRKWTAIDSCGNANACIQSITVRDSSKPVITCPPNVTINCQQNSTPFSTGTATATDNCTDVITNITHIDNRTNGSCNDNFTINRNWTAKDSCGNSNSCLQKITVRDTSKPLITCPADITLDCQFISSPSGAGVATATDNCTDIVTNITFADNKTNVICNNNYSITRVWTAIDSCGNVNNCIQKIRVQDTTKPSITCPVDISIDCQSNSSPLNTGKATATDECTDVVTNITNKDVRTNGSCRDNYIITRTWTAVDSCGNANSCIQIITVQDTSKPVISCPANVVINCQSNSAPNNTGLATATDNCTDQITNLTYNDVKINGSCRDNYVVNRTWTAVDSCGNANTCLQTITVQDTTRPAITCPVNITINCDANTSPLSIGFASATDNCTDVVTNITYQDSKNAGTCKDNYSITRTWVASDSCGNLNSCKQSITIQDTTKPLVNCPANSTVNCQNSSDLNQTGIATATDNCTGVVTNINYADTRTNGNCPSNYKITRVWTAIDSCGNASNCTQTIFVQDTTRPLISCPPNLVINCDASTDKSNTGIATATDNCSSILGISFSDIKVNNGCPYNSTITRTWKAVDSCGNSISCQQTISIIDTVKPTITCPLNVFISCESSKDSTKTGIAIATDNCTGMVTNISYVDLRTEGSCKNNYSIVRTWTAKDSCGNSSSCTQSIIAQDTTKPVLTCPADIIINCDANTDTSKTGIAVATDNCASVVSDIRYSDVKVNGSCKNSSTITRTWTATDSCGNAASCIQKISVQDTTKPVITCPVNITIDCAGSADPTGTGKAKATDNCTDFVTNIGFSDTRINGSCANDYTIRRRWTAADSCGNSTTCIQLIIVQDITKPAITCPVNITINCDQGIDTLITGKAKASDKCTDIVTDINYTDTKTLGSCQNNYTILRTWMAVDSCGNFNTCTQTIVVQDVTKPVIICPADLTIDCDKEVTPPVTGIATATDNCTSTVTNFNYVDSKSSGNCIGNYTINRIWTAIDSCGNSANCAQVITVQDTLKPSISCPANLTVDCDASTDPLVTGVSKATDNCTGLVSNIYYSDTRSNGNCRDNYTITRNWFAMDSCGNENTCIQIIVVRDTSKPIITCPADLIVDSGVITDPIKTGTATATDNCTDFVTNITYSDKKVYGNCEDNYTLRRTWTAIDSCGNAARCIQIITVQDTIKPIITCPSDISISCQMNATTNLTGVATATDNNTDVVTNITYSDSRLNGVCNDNFNIYRTWTAVDSCENAISCIQIITVQDTTRPYVYCPEDVTINCDISTDPAKLGKATSKDNCSNVVTDITYKDKRTNGSCNDNYTLVRTWIGTDSCGNSNFCTQKIKVQDTTRPKMVCPPNITISCDASLEPEQTGKATATDKCTDVVDNITYQDVKKDGTCKNSYTIIRSWSVKDSCGNSGSCVQTISVNDLIKPVLNCPADITIFCGESSDTSLTGVPTVSDICSDTVNVVYNDLLVAGGCIGISAIHRVWQATDECGNTSSCTQTIHIAKLGVSIIKTGKFIDTNNDGKADPGEKIVYTFKIKNTGSLKLLNLVVTDSILNFVSSPISSLSPGKTDSVSVTVTYIITQADIDLGYKKNTASVSGKDVNNEDVYDVDDEITYLPQKPAIGIANKLKSVDVLADGLVDVHMEITMRNNGNVALADLQITDDIAKEFGTYVSNVPVTVGEYTLHDISFVKNSTSPLHINPVFDGMSNQELLSVPEGGYLNTNEEVVLSLYIRLIPNKKEYYNQLVATGDLLSHDNPVGQIDGDPADASDSSDSGSNATNDPAQGGDNPGEPGDSGTVDDPTLIIIPGSKLCGNVWMDLNENGLRETGEPGKPGIEVELYRCDNVLMATDTTDSNGHYLFDISEVPMDYKIIVKLPDSLKNYVFTAQDTGKNDLIDSDVDKSGLGSCVYIVPGQIDSTYDAGLIQLASIGDLVWHDRNGDGLQTAGEEGIAGVEVMLYEAATNAVVDSTITDANGWYQFAHLMPNDYYLKFKTTSSWLTTKAKQGSDLIDSDVDDANGPATTKTIHVISGLHSGSWDLGLYKCALIEGDTWVDRDIDGIYDANERGVNKIKIYVIDAVTKKAIDTIVSRVKLGLPKKDGYYITNCLKPGKYYLQFELPSYFGMAKPYRGGNTKKDCDVSNANGPNTTRTFNLMSGDAMVNIAAGYQIKATGGGSDFNGGNDTARLDVKEANPVSFEKELKIIPARNTGEPDDDCVDNSFDECHDPDHSVIVINKILPDLDSQLLDVEWIAFDGTYNGNFVELNWTTGIEWNNDHFVLERRLESEREFKEIGKIAAHLPPYLKLHEYEFDDFDVSSSGIYYYRLKQVNKNGKVNYTKTISIEIRNEGEMNVSLYPNPVRDMLMINLWLSTDTEVESMILDQTGNVVKLNPFGGFMSSKLHEFYLRTSDLAAGVYVLSIRTNEGMIYKQFAVIK